MRKLIKLLLFSSLVLLVCLFLLAAYETETTFGREDSENNTTEENDYAIKETDDVVYALSNINLRSQPDMKGAAVAMADYGDEFKRTGITSNGWNRLLLSDGSQVYSLGICYSTDKLAMTDAVANFQEGSADIPQRIELPVAFISQLPQLPTGCEVTALATVLNYLGYPVDKETLADNYLPKGAVGSTDFREAFVGNPRKADSFGCYVGAILSAADNYFATVSHTHKVYDISGSSKEQLYREVRAGNPVLVWGTINNMEPYFTAEWTVNGEKLQWLAGEHCFVLSGFDLEKNTVIVSDALNGIIEYDADLFFTRYQQMYSQALVIKD